MKLKKAIVSILTVAIILSFSINVFAAVNNTTKKSKKTDNTVSNEAEENKSGIESIFKKSKDKNETSNSTSKNTKDDEDIDEDVYEDEDERFSSKKKNSKKDEEETVGVNYSDPSYENSIFEDVIKFNDDSEENIEYESTYIDGNLFVTTATSISLDNVKVDGDIFIVADNIKMVNTEVNGSIYLVSTNDINLEVQASSIYAVAGGNTKFDEVCSISKETRICGKSLDLSGLFGRTVYIIANNATVTDRTEIKGDLNIEASKIDISDEAIIDGETYETIIEDDGFVDSDSLKYRLIEIITEIIIILIVSIFILGGFPKFTEVNNRLRLRDFVKSFFTGILEILIVFLITLGIFVFGYGVGYGFALITLTIALVGLGKLIFILAFAIRISGKPERISKVKVFFMTILVALVVEAISLVGVLGSVGFVISVILNMIIGISGFGSLIRVILTSRKKVKNENTNKIEENNTENKNEENSSEQVVVAEEVRNEIEEEMKELQEEREKSNQKAEEVKKDEEKQSSKKDNNSENKKEKAKKVEKPKEEKKDDKKEDSKKTNSKPKKESAKKENTKKKNTKKNTTENKDK